MVQNPAAASAMFSQRDVITLIAQTDRSDQDRSRRTTISCAKNAIKVSVDEENGSSDKRRYDSLSEKFASVR